jgi:phospholipid/cholesterol/gamma-HCH transport system substrate-binding protein/paraquat-inducible protein B
MRRWSYFKIGVFVISAVAIGIAGVIALGIGTIFQKKSLVETYIEESVQGLDIGSPVKFRGVQIGTVEQITLTSVEYPTRRRYVLVRAGLDPAMLESPLADVPGAGWRAEIERGLRVRLAPQGFTGVAYLEADYLDPARYPPLVIDWEPAYPYIPSARSTITRITESVDRILRNVESVDIQRLTETMEKSLATISQFTAGANLDKIGLQVNAVLSELRETNRELKTIVTGPEIKSALGDAAAAAASARQIFARAEEPLNKILMQLPETSERIKNLAEKMDQAAMHLPETAAQVRETLGRLDRVIAGQQEDVVATVQNLRAASENVRDITESMRSYPGQVIFGSPPPPAKAFAR